MNADDMHHRAPAIVALLLVATPCAAGADGESPLTVSASVGIRSVDVAGAGNKFREDVNLDDGVRLFELALKYSPTPESKLPFDRIDLNANNLGGDPFESVHLSARKYGAWHLRLDHRRSEYFYEDTILPAALANPTSSNGGDFHHFNFERVRDSAALEVQLSPATQLSFGLARQTRSGDSTTTLDIQRDEFELDRPIDETLKTISFGIQHAWEDLTVILQEDIRDYDNFSRVFLPGASPGQNLTDPTALQFFILDQDYDYESRSHSLRVLGRPTPRLNVQGAWRREDLDLDMRATEMSEGTDFTGGPFSTDVSGPAAIGRDLEFSEVDLEFTVSDRIRLVGGAKKSSLRQQGLVQFGLAEGSGAWSIDTDGYELGMEMVVFPGLRLSLGWSSETRDTLGAQLLDGAGTTQLNSTERDGYFARLVYSKGRGFELTASVEDNSIDDPFALTSATANQRYRFSARKRWKSGWSLSGSYAHTNVDNTLSGWFGDTRQANTRLAYQRERLHFSAGYAVVDVEHSIDQLVWAGFRQDPFLISYAADSDFVDASARWRIRENITVGGDVRRYKNSGSFAVTRDDLQAFVEFALTTKYAVRIAYRTIDHAEDVFDDYDADVIELALRLNW